MSDKIYGLIGCGMMGIEHLLNVSRLDGVNLGVVYDPLPDNAARAAQLAGGARIAESVADLLGHVELDAVVICSPNFCHVEQLEEIAVIRPLPILCEKPLFTKPRDAARIAAFGAAFKPPVWVAMEYRYMPPIEALIAETAAATGGVKMLTLREHRIPFLKKYGDWNRFNENTGGTLVEKCCHFFDLMRLIIGSEPVRVMASAGQMVNHFDESYAGRTPDIWDGGYVIFDFASGTRAMLELCMFADGTKWNEEISCVGPVGKIECRIPGPQRFWPEHLGASPEPEVSLYPRHPKGPTTRILRVDPELAKIGDHHGSTYIQHAKFLNVVRGQGEVEVSLEDGCKAVQMGLAAQDAAARSCVVTFD